MNKLLNKIKSWEAITLYSQQAEFIHKRNSVNYDYRKIILGYLPKINDYYRDIIESSIKFIGFLKSKVEEELSINPENAYLEMADEYRGYDWTTSIFHEIGTGFSKDTFSLDHLDWRLVDYIITQYKIEYLLAGGMDHHFPKVEFSHKKFIAVEQKNDSILVSFDPTEMIENLNTLEHLRHSLLVAFEIFLEGSTPISILNYLKEKGIIEA